ncbi:putative transient receptor potential cation channel subfamily M member 2 [Apostichopus japonicus]|uniref:Putative transient receptor potential cation channel subfamily M member 2 n=1 Tax=Stichopus japonicus TaxID=307972 RepID=A0A2G8KEP6_STIJA|nr:putative transient receptor potential cation channel subfamily M member 2 [Apostichopus japonicus]
MDEEKQINRNSEGLEKISLGSITVSIDNAKNGANHPNVRHVPRQETVDVWSILSGSLLSEVRTRGTIKFKGVKNVYRDPRARFVVVDDNADTTKVLEVFTKGWKLGKPKLLVNICGGDEKFEVNNHLKEIFRHSLLHAARTIDAWILTNGLNSGVMKFLGRSLRDFAVSSANRRGKNTFPIGIVDLNTIENGSCFRQSHNSNSRCEVVYDTMHRDSDPDGDTTVLLNPYHPYFVLVDSDSEQSRSKCNEFRCTFMEKISNMKLMGTNTTIPVVTLVIGGGAQSIHIAHRLAMNRSPLVILAGSGGAADILEFAYRYVQSGGGIKREDEIKFTSGLNARLQSSCGPEDRVELLAKCKDMVRRKYNVAIYHLHGTSIPTGLSLCPVHEDIVEAIIASLPKGEKGNQLHLAVVWNLLELVKRYLKENRSWKDDDLHRSFEFALCNDQTDIIDQFLQHGINVQDFLNQSKLASLYAKIVDDCLLKDMLEEKRFQDTKPLYDRHEDYTFDNPMRELFIWAVLQMRIKTAKLFWFEDKSPLGGALLACKMMKAMSEYEQDPQQIDQMETLACEYERWAVEILDDYYKEDRRKTSLSIIRELEDWGRVSCLCLPHRKNETDYRSSSGSKPPG